MKTIYITEQFKDDWNRVLNHIANLFYEDSVIKFTKDGSDMSISFTHAIDEQFTITTAAKLIVDGQEYTSDYSIGYATEGTEKEQNIRMKRALSHVMLDVLEQYTGMTQQWGILTGVRPTKLYHKYRKAGLPEEEIFAVLKKDFRLSDAKISLMKEIVARQLQIIPDLDEIGQEISIYIGVPFCPTMCAYCTFPAYAIQSNRKAGRVEKFIDGLHIELREMGKWLTEKNMRITSIYWGGGTPTSIEAEEMDALYQTMFDSFPNKESIREITVEAGRPDTITPEKIEVLKKWGIDRISVNPQSYTQETLKAIGRHHTVQETVDKFWLSRNMGMNNINMDLIIGLPNEGIEEFKHSLEESAKMQPESLTVHTLSFKRASEMTRNKDKYKVADRDTVAEMMQMASNWTKENGYVPYYLYRQKNILGNLENVGYCKPGEESIYNIVIMEEVQTILGIGCGASSKFVHPVTGKITQFHNPKDPAAYIMTFEDAIKKKIDILNELYS
ncbi:coproporphyrinogen III oxidase [Lysinibacillus odysseyi]|uniref:Coproporphyrinogen III oxidase n=1 Tax=Lysinibacillus odysseyi 34hs-1 = NBRC 100172 TaxID=1220589 RepID=A0A0A3IDU1_9BACI|nr:coproporphyrinogen III oxidase [Lysinibacillus odysseyi]KGR82879.1 coproporphyrinogen III oxidase [Lysinibacillus odysseyi 34hs-1 = NBRC 100172]